MLGENRKNRKQRFEEFPLKEIVFPHTEPTTSVNRKKRNSRTKYNAIDNGFNNERAEANKTRRNVRRKKTNSSSINSENFTVDNGSNDSRLSPDDVEQRCSWGLTCASIKRFLERTVFFTGLLTIAFSSNIASIIIYFNDDIIKAWHSLENQSSISHQPYQANISNESQYVSGHEAYVKTSAILGNTSQIDFDNTIYKQVEL